MYQRAIPRRVPVPAEAGIVATCCAMASEVLKYETYDVRQHQNIRTVATLCRIMPSHSRTVSCHSDKYIRDVVAGDKKQDERMRQLVEL